MTKRRAVVAYVCLDSDGKYSFDAPSPVPQDNLQMGTTATGDGNVEDTLNVLKGQLERVHDQLVSAIKENSK